MDRSSCRIQSYEMTDSTPRKNEKIGRSQHMHRGGEPTCRIAKILNYISLSSTSVNTSECMDEVFNWTSRGFVMIKMNLRCVCVPVPCPVQLPILVYKFKFIRIESIYVVFKILFFYFIFTGLSGSSLFTGSSTSIFCSSFLSLLRLFLS